MNNSNKIVVVNSSDFAKTATISGLNSPRYILPVTYNKAYVSDLYSNSIRVVDLNSNTISGNIPCINGTEQMAMIYNKAFVTCSNSNYCYVINTITDAITDSINVGKGNSSICIDKNSKIWILSTGNSGQSIAGKLSRINPVTLQVEQSLNFVNTDSPNKLCINKTRDTLYYLNNGVYQFPIISSALPASPLINQGSKLYYGLGVNPKDYSIYVADAIDYVQKSKIEIYKPNGSYISNFNAGIISNGFMFE
jgi:DNA-binding beta-propeller fold protein YncE